MKIENLYTSYLPLVGILLLSLLVFSPTFFNDFQMGWDDQWMVMNPYTPNGLKWGVIKLYFKDGFTGQFAPINQLMYSLLYAIDGYNPLIFHAAGLFIHLLNVSLVFFLLKRILQDLVVIHIGDKNTNLIVFITTFLFAIHPLQVETVAWISASKILLSSTFYLLSTYLLVLYIKEHNCVLYILLTISYFLSYLSKEQVVIFPLLSALICIWYKIKPNTLEFWKIVLPISILSLVLGLHFLLCVSSYNLFVSAPSYTWWQRVIFFFYSIVTYVIKWCVPVNLNWMYYFPVSSGDVLPGWMFLYPLLLIIILYSFSKFILNKFVFSSLLVMIIHLLLVVHLFVLPRGAIVADRYMYLSIIGLNLIISYILINLGMKIKRKQLLYVILLMYSLILSFISYSRTQDWENTDKLKNEKRTIL